MENKEPTNNELLTFLQGNMVTKRELVERLDILRTEVQSDTDVLLDKHLQTYMKRFDDLAKRVKRIEETLKLDPIAS